MDEEDCEHLFSDVYCPRCGKFAGQVCEFCGVGSDGGDYLASQEDIWCQCTADELIAFYEQQKRQEGPC